MTGLRAKRPAFWALIFALIITVCVPTLASAQGRGRGLDKKAEKFKNGHDARDGRWDGRGPRDDRYDRDDDFYDNDDRYDRGRRRRDRDRDDDRFNDRSGIRRQAVSIGYRDGFNAGRNDRARGERFNYTDERSYRDATRGYNGYGSIDFYRNSYRQGFRQGYEEGYRNGRWRGGILGGILGGFHR
jgi:hypothetical protein